MSTTENQTPEIIEKSKYEYTLSEFPVVLLSKKGIKNFECIEYQDTISGNKGEVVEREWRVYPHSKLGFGTASTQSTLFELFQIWKEQSFDSQYIQFGSLYSLLKRRGLADNKQNYERITRDLKCLVGITIEAKNAFWDNEVGAYVDMTFHLFERLELFKENPQGQATLPLGRIKASDILYGSVSKNSLLLANFNSEFFHSLTGVEQRLALYLEKVLKNKHSYKREIVEFASQIPLEVKEPKYIKRQFKKACEGLIKKGYSLLASFNFEKTKDGKSQNIIFFRKGIPPNPKRRPLSPEAEKRIKQLKLAPASTKAPDEIEYLTHEILEFCEDKKSLNFYKKVARLVDRNTIFRALSEARAAELQHETKRNKAAHFTWLIKKYAKEQGIAL